MTILITGGTGFVGAAVADHLARQQRRAIVFAAHPAPKGFLAAGVDTIIGDVTDPDAVAAALRGAGVTAVIHAAAMTAGPDQERRHPERVIAVNVAGTAAVLRAASEAGIGRVVVASSGSVYPLAPAREARLCAGRDLPDPAGLYGLTKLAAEQVAQRLAIVYGLSVPIVRLAAVYGPFERDTGVREILSAQAQVVSAARAGEPVRLSRPGFGAWLYSRDAAAGLVALADATFTESSPIFDLGGLEPFSVLDFCQAIAPAFPGWRYGLDAGNSNIRFQLPADRTPLDFLALKAATGFAPSHGLAAAAADYLAWLRSAG